MFNINQNLAKKWIAHCNTKSFEADDCIYLNYTHKNLN